MPITVVETIHYGSTDSTIDLVLSIESKSTVEVEPNLEAFPPPSIKVFAAQRQALMPLGMMMELARFVQEQCELLSRVKYPPAEACRLLTSLKEMVAQLQRVVTEDMLIDLGGLAEVDVESLIKIGLVGVLGDIV